MLETAVVNKESVTRFTASNILFLFIVTALDVAFMYKYNMQYYRTKDLTREFIDLPNRDKLIWYALGGWVGVILYATMSILIIELFEIDYKKRRTRFISAVIFFNVLYLLLYLAAVFESDIGE